MSNSDFRWLIEAPSSRYLATRKLGQSYEFHWTEDHNAALAFRSKDQAEGAMMALREMNEKICGAPYLGLFGFEVTLGNARAIEHGWLNPDSGKKS